MMRLLFLSIVLLRAVVSEESDGSGDYVTNYDDEEDLEEVTEVYKVARKPVAAATGEEQDENLTMIIIIVAAVVMVLSVAAVITILLIRRRMQSHQPGVYSVPTEQDQKVAV